MPEVLDRATSKFASIKVGKEFNTKAFHHEMQKLRQGGDEVTLKSYLADVYGSDYTPAKFYAELGINLGSMQVDKMLNTSEVTRWLFPEIMRDAIIRGLDYTPIYPTLITGDEPVQGTGLTMPAMDWTSTMAQEALKLRDVNEGATIPEGEIITWQEKQVTVKKKARGLKQTYESIMFTPINLASIYFEELGTRLGIDLDKDFINIALNGDQADSSQSAPVIGASVTNTLTYQDIARAWIRFRRIGRQSAAMITNEADATTILSMAQFQRTQQAATVTPSGVTLNANVPLPTSQDIYVHDAMPDKKILFIDPSRAFVKLTAMPLLIESEKIVSRQIQGEYVSIITGFANIFKDGRLLLDYSTSLTTNPGPTVSYS